MQSNASQVSIVESADWNLVQQNSNNWRHFAMPPWNGEMAAVSINSLAYPTNVTLVRQAIVHAINYSDIAQKVFFGQIAPVIDQNRRGSSSTTLGISHHTSTI